MTKDDSPSTSAKSLFKPEGLLLLPSKLKARSNQVITYQICSTAAEAQIRKGVTAPSALLAKCTVVTIENALLTECD